MNCASELSKDAIGKTESGPEKKYRKLLNVNRLYVQLCVRPNRAGPWPNNGRAMAPNNNNNKDAEISAERP
jgi:hypothetical protein